MGKPFRNTTDDDRKRKKEIFFPPDLLRLSGKSHSTEGWLHNGGAFFGRS